MTKSLEKLINVGFALKVYFKVPSYSLFQYEDGSYIEFCVRKVTDLPKLIELCQGLDVKLFGGDAEILVRVEEDPFSLDEDNG